MLEQKLSRRIAILREEVSRKIAAGEVIDRPFSIVRELVDNAIDARADRIDLYLEGGGLSRISVVDNGQGMSKEDLSLCTHRYATSKIREDEDLYRIHSLGFRGEALASIAACSRLEIVSREQGGHACRLIVHGGRLISLTEFQGSVGVRAEVAELFYNMPARKRFMKSAGAETQRCRAAFLDKALPHAQIAFRFFVDGKLKDFFPADSVEKRIASAFGLDGEHLTPIQHQGGQLQMSVVAARPELNRRDRKMIQVFVNRRRVYEYALIQAVQQAYSPYLPGGGFPIAFVFLEIDPALVDFNIHPAKREVRFRDLPAVHRALVGTLKNYLKRFDIKAGTEQKGWEKELSLEFPAGERTRPYQPIPSAQALSPAPSGFDRGGRDADRSLRVPPVGGTEVSESGRPFRYHGQLFGLFLLVEAGDSLYIVDQHAAHERLLMNEFVQREPVVQDLLLPIRFAVGEAEKRLLEEQRDQLAALGINIEQSEPGFYEIKAMPEELLAVEQGLLIQALLSPNPEGLREKIYSLAACHLAVKEGEELDPPSAEDLIRRVLALANARCPHGRPIWYRLDRDELKKRVGRI